MKFQGYTRFQLKLGGLAVDDINRFIACRNVLDKDDVLVGDANTGRFCSGLGSYLLKQEDDMYIQAVSMADLDAKLKIAAKEAMDHGCTWSICKFLQVGLSIL